MRPSRRGDFDIAIICVLPLEYDAVSYTFDEFWDEDGDQYKRAIGDTNFYTTGRMGNYSVVLALLSQLGKAGAAGAAASMRSSYTGMRLALLTSVCGSVPRVDQHEQIFLGDVIISKTVFQYDFGWQFLDVFLHKNTVEDTLGRADRYPWPRHHVRDRSGSRSARTTNSSFSPVASR
jgi:nucleoside phosphorylase